MFKPIYALQNLHNEPETKPIEESQNSDEHVFRFEIVELFNVTTPYYQLNENPYHFRL